MIGPNTNYRIMLNINFLNKPIENQSLSDGNKWTQEE